jgi:oxalate decarboxylase/phosphoglucose isomerase-like protein (cupin superfamily)
MKLLFNEHDIGGEVVKNNDTYVVKDNKTLKNIVLSSTCLYRGKMTTGHAHPGQEEVYIFARGSGIMIVDEDKFRVGGGSIVLVPDGAFHKVINDGDTNLIFNCVFDGKRNH